MTSSSVRQRTLGATNGVPAKDPPSNAKSSPRQTDRFLGVVCMFGLALQYGLQPFLTKRYTPKIVNKVVLVMASEVVKFIYGTLTLAHAGRLGTFYANLAQRLYYAFPVALIYAVQNWCAQVAYANVDSITFNCLNQVKMISTALFLYFMLNLKQSRIQLLALALLLMAAILLQHKPSSESGAAIDLAAYNMGVLAILAASMLSGLASALCVRTLKMMMADELTVSMSIASTIVIAGGLIANQADDAAKVGWMHGWTETTIIPVLGNAFGGVMVGYIQKTLGGVAKSFAVVGGLIITGVVESVVTNVALPAPFMSALAMVIAAVWLHTNFPYKEPPKADVKQA